MPSFINIGLVVFYCGWCKVGDVNFFVIMEACQVAAGHRPDHPICIHLVRPSLATDQLLSWLLTYISFVVDHRWTFRSIIDIGIDSIHIGRRIFSVNHSGAPCLQLSTSGSARMRDTVPYQLMSWHGISKHQNTAEFRRNCRAEYGIITCRTIYSNAK